MEPKQTPSSCRNGTTSAMLSSNGTLVYVKASIIPHNPAGAAAGLALGASLTGGSDTTWAVTVERSSQAQLLNERRLQLLVGSDGKIVWATPGCPSSLFGQDPASMVGTKISSLIDVFTEYETGEGVVVAVCGLSTESESTGRLPGHCGSFQLAVVAYQSCPSG